MHIAVNFITQPSPDDELGVVGTQWGGGREGVQFARED